MQESNNHLKSVVSRILHKLLYDPNEVWHSSEEDSSETYLELLRKAKTNIKIVCGECDPKFYEQPQVVGTLTNLLENNGRLELVAGLLDNEKDAKEAAKRLCNANKGLYKLVKEHPQQVSVYLAHTRPEQHYTIVDSKHVFIEEPHPPYKQRPTRARFDDDRLGREWERRFNEYIHVKMEQNQLTALHE